MKKWVRPELTVLIIDHDSPNYIAFASGLDISGDMHESLETHLMVEYLTGELLCSEVSLSGELSDIRIKNESREYHDLSWQATLYLNLKLPRQRCPKNPQIAKNTATIQQLILHPPL